MIEIQEITEVLQYVEGLEAVIFDLDDTLYSEKEYVRSGYKAVARILPEVEHAEERLLKYFEENLPAFDTLLQEEGIFTEERKRQCLAEYRYHKPEIHLYAGVVEMLTELRDRGYKLGVITDGRTEGQRKKIDVLGFEKYVDCIIITDELGGIEYRKPCEKAFCLMKRELNIEFGQMCYVGDNMKKDFIAPERLGMQAIWFRNRDGIYV